MFDDLLDDLPRRESRFFRNCTRVQYMHSRVTVRTERAKMTKMDKMFKVVGNDGNTYALVDTREQAEKVVAMKKLTRDGVPIGPKTSADKLTKVSNVTMKIVEVPASDHPGYVKEKR